MVLPRIDSVTGHQLYWLRFTTADASHLPLIPGQGHEDSYGDPNIREQMAAVAAAKVALEKASTWWSQWRQP